MRARRKLVGAGAGAALAVISAGVLLPVVMVAVAMVVVVVECRSWLRATLRPVVVRLNGHPVHVLDFATVDLADRTVVLARVEHGVSVDGVTVRRGRTRRLGDLDVEVA